MSTVEIPNEVLLALGAIAAIIFTVGIGLLVSAWWRWWPVGNTDGRSPLPANRDAIVRLLGELEQNAEEYFRACASTEFPPKWRFPLLDQRRRASVDALLKKIHAEFRVANNGEVKDTWVAFQGNIGDIMAHGRYVTEQELPDLNARLSRAVNEFQKALDRGAL